MRSIKLDMHINGLTVANSNEYGDCHSCLFELEKSELEDR